MSKVLEVFHSSAISSTCLPPQKPDPLPQVFLIVMAMMMMIMVLLITMVVVVMIRSTMRPLQKPDPWPWAHDVSLIDSNIETGTIANVLYSNFLHFLL